MIPLLPFAAALAAGLPTEAEVFAGVLARFDGDGNGTISLTEYARFDTAANFASMDLDASGEIDAEELTAWVKVTQPRPVRERPDAPGGKEGPPDEVLFQVLDPAGLAEGARSGEAALLTMTVGPGRSAAILNDAGKGVDIAGGDRVYSGLGPRPAPGTLAVEVKGASRVWQGEADFAAATANTSAPLALRDDGGLEAHRGPVPIGSRKEPAAAQRAPAAAPPAPAEASSAWPWYAAIVGVGVVAGTWIELRGRARRRAGRDRRRR